MWHKRDAIGVWIWVPDNYVFRESVAFFTMQNNILDENKQIRHFGLDILKDRATIVIYENGATPELVNEFCEYVTLAPIMQDQQSISPLHASDESVVSKPHSESNEKSPFAAERGGLSAIGIFSFKRNRYSKPFTGAMELLQELARDAITTQNGNTKAMSMAMEMANRKSGPAASIGSPEVDPPNSSAQWMFRPEWSIVVSPHIGIGGRYVDRAFAHNVGIQTVVTPELYFKLSTAKVSWNWPQHVITEAQKRKLFLFQGEPRFSQFLTTGQNLVIITGPPNSGKTILGRRVAQFIGGCTICKNELPPAKSFGAKSIVHISCAPSAREKERLVKWLAEHIGRGELRERKINSERTTQSAVNLVWIEMAVPRQLAEFMRNLRVQISRQTCPSLAPYSEIKHYYKTVEPLDPDKIPAAITPIKFPLILKKIKELDYIF